MLLHMTVQQRKPGIVRDKIHFDSLVRRDVHHILDDPGGRLPIKLDQFETMPV